MNQCLQSGFLEEVLQRSRVLRSCTMIAGLWFWIHIDRHLSAIVVDVHLTLPVDPRKYIISSYKCNICIMMSILSITIVARSMLVEPQFWLPGFSTRSSCGICILMWFVVVIAALRIKVPSTLASVGLSLLVVSTVASSSASLSLILLLRVGVLDYLPHEREYIIEPLVCNIPIIVSRRLWVVIFALLRPRLTRESWVLLSIVDGYLPACFSNATIA